MNAPLHRSAPQRRRRRAQQDAAVVVVACAALLAWIALSQPTLGARVVEAIRAYEHLTLDVQIVAAVVLATAAAQIAGFDRYLWHMAANATAFERPGPLIRAWVIDGDTVDGDGVRYRLANIDAPETGDNAKCFLERERGEEAKRAAIKLVRSANVVAVRRTWRTDRFGRRVAFVLVDGADLGRLLVAQGLAQPWRGKRERWCGKRGGLAKIARAGARPHACATCRDWR
jgi:endonuclease YncB( thermonuclease family)